MKPILELELAGTRFAPGDRVAGTVRVVASGRSRSLQVTLQYVEETGDYKEVATSVSSGPLHAGDLAAPASFDFTLALPANALPNVTSPHGSLYWEIDVKSDALGPDTHERRQIVVSHAATG